MKESLFREALSAPPNAIGYRITEALHAEYPDAFVFESRDLAYDMATFLRRTGVPHTLTRTPTPVVQHFWTGRVFETQVEHARQTIEFEGETFEVVRAEWFIGNQLKPMTWIVGPSEAATVAFATRVIEIASEIRGEVLVFANGCWSRSTPLHQAIQGSQFANLVLADSMADAILDDFRSFLNAKERYAAVGAPWKRGVLFTGPPGNGKTHCVKALLNELDVPCLYVQSFEARYTNPQRNVHEVFKRARRTTPCVLVLEDLDSLLSDKTRSFFLNELDGFAANEGIITLATTNHPNRLDPAIVDRPSRFDRKYNFTLPQVAERRRFLALWHEQLSNEANLGDALGELATRTEDFSYAYLKELMLSSLMAWASHGGTFADVALRQVEGLRAQMKSTTFDASPASYVTEYPEVEEEDEL
ncbi:MAG: ATP-binding protein [Myxococcota bacterium]